MNFSIANLSYTTQTFEFALPFWSLISLSLSALTSHVAIVSLVPIPSRAPAQNEDLVLYFHEISWYCWLWRIRKWERARRASKTTEQRVRWGQARCSHCQRKGAPTRHANITELTLAPSMPSMHLYSLFLVCIAVIACCVLCRWKERSMRWQFGGMMEEWTNRCSQRNRSLRLYVTSTHTLLLWDAN